MGPALTNFVDATNDVTVPSETATLQYNKDALHMNNMHNTYEIINTAQVTNSEVNTTCTENTYIASILWRRRYVTIQVVCLLLYCLVFIS